MGSPSGRKLLFQHDGQVNVDHQSMVENPYTVMLAQQEVGEKPIPSTLPLGSQNGSPSSPMERKSKQKEMGASKQCLNQCSQQGKCQGGKCYCDPGFTGDDCGKTVDCPNGCNSHGICQFGLCFCDPGWTAHDCSEVQPCLHAPNNHASMVVRGMAHVCMASVHAHTYGTERI